MLIELDRLDEVPALLDPLAGNTTGEERLRHQRVHGEWLRRSGRYDEALAWVEQAVEDHRDAQSPDLQTAMGNLAAVQLATGDALGALRTQEQVVATAREQGPLAHGRALNNLAVLIEELGDADRAAEVLEASIALLVETLGERHPDVASARCSLGGLQRARGAVEEAVETCRRCLQDGSQGRSDARAEATHRRSLASALLQLGQLDAARAELERAGAVSRLPPEHPDSLRGEQRLGILELWEGKPGLARERLEAALARQQAALGEAHPDVAETHRLLAEVALAEQQPARARAHVEVALDLAKAQLDWLNGLSDGEALALSRQLTAVRDTALDVLLQAEDPDAAWEVARTFKGAATRRIVRRAQVARHSDDPELLALWQQLTHLRRSLLAQVETASGSLAPLLAEKEALERAVAEHIGEPPTEETEACARLEPGEVLLDLYVVRDQLWTFRTDASCVVALEVLPWGQDERRHLQAWRLALEQDAWLEGPRGERVARWLAPVLEPLVSAEKVWISPDGVLSALPWSALPTGPHRRLLEHTNAVVLPLADGRPPTLMRARHLLTVGGVDYGPPDCDGTALSPLPATAVESTALSRLWRDATVLSGERATPTAVLDALAGAELVHLATHGVTDGGPCGSPSAPAMLRTGLALSGANQRVGALLTAEALSASSLEHCQLAILSACNTGMRQRTAGEGVLGLQRGFAIAGAAELVMSLWSVPDEPTRQLVTDMARELRRGRPAARALRRAQLDALARARRTWGEDRPASWAAWVVSASGY